MKNKNPSNQLKQACSSYYPEILGDFISDLLQNHLQYICSPSSKVNPALAQKRALIISKADISNN